jgi:pimeloyl-ACP methyl ester carboxylesterase
MTTGAPDTTERAEQAAELTLQLPVYGMTCSSCTASVTGALGGLEGVRRVQVDLDGHTVVVEGERGAVKAMRAMGAVVGRLPNSLFRPVFASFIRLGQDDASRATESLDIHWSNYAEHHVAAAMIRQVRSLDVRDTLAVQDALRDLHVPARVVWGAADHFEKVQYGFAWDLRTEMHRIEGGKHWTPEDHPNEIAAATKEVLREVATQ